ncbi:SRPBCC domain-containing protein [Aurantiacibacter zhengii]|uniref:ATPase n=1 Tax=Aurantiacibacter zhengii TaxID=2307003 RepID=A0A418NX52_9SPHN|nr:SRPBCC domain-containing protein [Aurantiacibacter zhengii]RIV89189.1 ATPase [Aurantiacibacter zhengii]
MRILLTATLAVLAASSARAEVVDSSSGGFATHDSAVVAADRRAVWDALIHPEGWWTHTWSDSSANLSLDARAGGCFCETLPNTAGWGEGSVEHMRIITVMPGSVLRMAGALGPLQSEGLAGTLTVTLEDVDTGTRISWDYVAGGQARFPADRIAPVVDRVQSEFLAALVAHVGGPVE